MTDETAQYRMGLLGDVFDPVGQLMQEAHPPEKVLLRPIFPSTQDLASVDEIVVFDQDVALAHFRFLTEADLPVTLILRRRKTSEEALAWQTGLSWLAACLRESAADAITLRALTPSAAEELSSATGLPVTALEPLVAFGEPRPIVPIDRERVDFSFYLDGANGQRVLRRAQLDSFNWARLRRLGYLRAADPDDIDFADLAEWANGSDGTGPYGKRSGNRPCFICVIPNGTGLGHLTRCLAVAYALRDKADARVVFWTFSRAAQIVESAGFEVLLRQTARHLSAHPPDWRRWETLEFAATIRALRPQFVIFDGGTFDPFMIDALRMPGCGNCGLAWIRRGMLQATTDAQILESEQYCDLVLEPGDLAVEQDVGPTRTRVAQYRGFSRTLESNPVTLQPYLPIYSRREAKRRLKLGWSHHCLISLGGAFGDWDSLVRQIHDAALRHRIQLVWARSPLAQAPARVDTKRIVRQIFPLARYMTAFDGMITATGYNSFQELMLSYSGPVLFAPTNNVRLDDQVARARHAELKGWASVIYPDKPDESTHVLETFFEQVKSGAQITSRPEVEYGAETMADAILSLRQRYEPVGS